MEYMQSNSYHQVLLAQLLQDWGQFRFGPPRGEPGTVGKGRQDLRPGSHAIYKRQEIDLLVRHGGEVSAEQPGDRRRKDGLLHVEMYAMNPPKFVTVLVDDAGLLEAAVDSWNRVLGEA